MVRGDGREQALEQSDREFFRKNAGGGGPGLDRGHLQPLESPQGVDEHGRVLQPGADVVDDWREYVKRRTEHREAFVAEQQRQAKEQEEAQKQYVKAVVRRSGKTSMRSRLVAPSVSLTWQASLSQGGVGSRRATRRLRAWSGTRSRGSWSGRAGCRRSSRGRSSEGDTATSSF